MEKNIKKVFTIGFFIAVNLIFVLSDWNIQISSLNLPISDILTFTSLILISILLLLGFVKNELSKKCLMEYFIPIGLMGIFLFTHLLIQLIFNSDFSLVSAIISTFKLVTYVSFILFIYLFLKNTKYSMVLYRITEITALIVVSIGLFIGAILYLSNYIDINKNIYEIFWTFTRVDVGSYLLRGTNLIRLRSIFSEPSYYGTYINVILMLFYFNNINVEFSYKITRPLLILSVLMTFALSAIAVYLIIEFLYIYTKVIKLKKLDFNKNIKRYLLLFLIVMIFMCTFRNAIDQAIIQRVKLMLAGGDGSAFSRIIGSWKYVNNFFIGNGIAQTPAIWNYFAYILSDFGIFVFLLYVILMFKTLKYDKYILISYIIIHFSRGGVFSAFNFMTILLILMFKSEKKHRGVTSDYIISTNNCE